MNENSAGAAIQKLKDKIQLLDAEAEAESLLSYTDESKVLDEKFKSMESNMKADQALAQLKSRMGHTLNSSGIGNSAEAQIRDVSPVGTKKVGNQ
jgi:phage shock protein A